jgi:lipoprotein-anchoring transpeptidase ErfK/SrfK
MKRAHLTLVWPLAAVILASAGCSKLEGKISVVPSQAEAMARQAETLLGEGKKAEAKAAYEKIIAEHADYKDIVVVQQALYKLNMDILFSDTVTPETVIHEVVSGDTLGKISRQYNVTQDLIKASNGMKNDTVRLGQKLRIWTGKFSILVNKSQNYLMLKSNEEVLKNYTVSTGANGSTPVGTFKIITKLEDPVWYKSDAVIPPESPANVLGTRWMGFDIKGYGIHGTVEPDKMGQQVTAGCVRMLNSDVEELFKIVPRGTEVVVVE